jgi:uncharacterized membrane protein
VHRDDPVDRDEAVTGRYLRAAVVGASLVGLGVAVYLTFVHFSAAQLVCTVGGAINCERVLGSGYAVIAGTAVPTSAAGIVWFTVAGALAVLHRRRAQIAWSVIGLLTVVYLVFVEIVQLGAICIWCTAAHAMVVVIFLLTVTVRAEAA